MERVAFLVEQTGERIACMLNPESVVVRRWAGVRPLRAVGGGGAVDDPLLQSGGGTTELMLDLLFDVSLTEGPAAIDDVRGLTRPLWQLTEANDSTSDHARFVRLVWGKTWNVRAVIAAIAERLEYFGNDGAPGRSWMRMRLLRVDDDAAGESSSPQLLAGSPDETQVHEIPPVLPEDTEHVPSVTRIDQVVAGYYGDPSLWKEIARLNAIDDPLRIAPGALLRMPPRTELESA